MPPRARRIRMRVALLLSLFALAGGASATIGHVEEYRYLTPSWWYLDCPMEPNDLGYYEGGACLTVRPGETKVQISVVDDLQGLVPAVYNVYIGIVSYQTDTFCSPTSITLIPGATHVEVGVSAVSGPLFHDCALDVPGVVGTIRGVFT